MRVPGRRPPAAVAALLCLSVATLAPPPAAAQPETFLELDGTVEPAETEGGTVLDLAPGRLTVRVEENLIRVAIETEPLDVASLCLATADSIYVLHASAALGWVEYSDVSGPWTPSGSGFDWMLRASGTEIEGAARREAYYRDNGWAANTQEMGTPGATEFWIDRELTAWEPARIAVGLMPEAEPEAIHSWPAGEAGCGDPALVSGEVPEELTFDPAGWLEIGG